MELAIILVLLFAISFIGSLMSLRLELKKPNEIKKIENDLSNEKILFKQM